MQNNTYIFFHGGESFNSDDEYQNWILGEYVSWSTKPYEIPGEKKKWKTEIAKKLVLDGNTVYFPNFPNQTNAKYDEWKRFFDVWKEQIELQGNIVLIGNSLGGCFLLKYLSDLHENQDILSASVISVHLVSACLSAGDFSEPENFEFLRSLGKNVHIWHAEDDTIVPISIGHAIAKHLPEAQTHFFGSGQGYGHFHKTETLGELEAVLLQK